MTTEISSLHKWSKSPINPSVARLERNTKLVIELDENYELSRYPITVECVSDRPAIRFLNPTDARDCFPGANWHCGVDNATRTHIFEAVIDGVVISFHAPFSNP